MAWEAAPGVLGAGLWAVKASSVDFGSEFMACHVGCLKVTSRSVQVLLNGIGSSYATGLDASEIASPAVGLRSCLSNFGPQRNVRIVQCTISGIRPLLLKLGTRLSDSLCLSLHTYNLYNLQSI